MRGSRLGWYLAGGVALGAMIGAAAGAVVSETRRRHELADDEDYQTQLRSPLRGAPGIALSTDGTQLYTEVFGPDAAPSLVLIPGWTEELHYYDLLTRGLLGRGFRVVSYDLRGQGASGEPAGGDQRIERYGEDVEAVLAATCAGREDVIVAGHSMGAMALAAWAGEFDATARIRAAALINTGMADLVLASTLLPQRLPEALRNRIGVRYILGGTGRYPPVSTPVSRALTRYAAFGPEATAAQVALYEPMLWRISPAVRAAAGLTCSTLDLRSALARLTVPTLVVAGEADRMTPPSHADEIASSLPNLSEHLLLPACGHMAPLERPAALVDAFVRLSERVGIGAGAAR